MEEPVQRFQRLSAKMIRRCGYHFPVGAWTHAHWCPACEELHDFAVEQPFTNGARWTVSGLGFEAPTLSPSMNITVGPFPVGSEKPGAMEVCHYFLTNGKLLYLTDCTHRLAGQTVELPDIPARALQYMTEVSQ
jgi:hypothetical protein